jgi:DNA polymerase-3 subunit alpha
VTQRLHAPFSDVDDFLERVYPGLEQMILLIRVGALESFGIAKKELLWHAHMRLNKVPQDVMQTSMFRTESKVYQLPELEHHRLEDAYDQLELLGFPLGSPFEWMAPDAVQSIVDLGVPIVTAEQLSERLGQDVVVLGYRVTLKPTTTASGKPMYFGTFLDINGDFIDTVHFPVAAEKFSIQGWGIFWLRGKVSEEFDVITLEVISAGRVRLLPDPRHCTAPVSSRDNQSINDRWVNRYLKRGN